MGPRVAPGAPVAVHGRWEGAWDCHRFQKPGMGLIQSMGRWTSGQGHGISLLGLMEYAAFKLFTTGSQFNHHLQGPSP